LKKKKIKEMLLIPLQDQNRVRDDRQKHRKARQAAGMMQVLRPADHREPS
jgi:hypothetical protein